MEDSDITDKSVESSSGLPPTAPPLPHMQQLFSNDSPQVVLTALKSSIVISMSAADSVTSSNLVSDGSVLASIGSVPSETALTGSASSENALTGSMSLDFIAAYTNLISDDTSQPPTSIADSNANSNEQQTSSPSTEATASAGVISKKQFFSYHELVERQEMQNVLAQDQLAGPAPPPKRSRDTRIIPEPILIPRTRTGTRYTGVEEPPDLKPMEPHPMLTYKDDSTVLVCWTPPGYPLPYLFAKANQHHWHFFTDEPTANETVQSFWP